MKSEKILLESADAPEIPQNFMQAFIALLELAKKNGYVEEAQKAMAECGIKLEIEEEQ